MRDHLRGKRTIILSNRSIVIQCSSVGIPLVKNVLHAVLIVACRLENYYFTQNRLPDNLLSTKILFDSVLCN